MININGIQPPTAPRAIEATQPAAAAAAGKAEVSGISDVVEISTVAKLAAQIQELPAVRTELVEQVKTEIAAGAYETTDKIDITVERLMDELFLQS